MVGIAEHQVAEFHAFGHAGGHRDQRVALEGGVVFVLPTPRRQEVVREP